MTAVGKRNHRVLDLADAPERLVADAHRPSCLRLTCPADCRQCGSRPDGLSMCSEAGAQGDDVNATSTQDVRLPQQGLSRETIREELRRAARGDLEPVPAMAAGVQYPAGDDVLEVASDAYLSFFSTNGLLPSIFPSLARFEHDVISMTAGILHGDRAVGSITSGGSESILMGVKSARDRERELHAGGSCLPFAEQLGNPVSRFDFRVPGVTTISAALHKSDYAAKGASTNISRDPDLFRHQVFRFGGPERPDDWYVTPSMTGTRPGGAIAAAWAVLMYLGNDGYVRLVDRTMRYLHRFWDGINAIPGLEVMGRPH